MEKNRDPNAVLQFSAEELSGSLSGRFARVAGEFPDRTAVKAGDDSLTYRELDRVTERVAQGLRLRLGDGAEGVAVLVTPGLATVTALLGIIKAGKFYCALSPRDPAGSRQAILGGLKPRLLITDAAHRSQSQHDLPEEGSLIDLDELAASAPQVGLPGIQLGPRSRAAIFHTSGTTGEPKGIPFPHQLMLNRAWLDNRMIGIRPGDRLIMLRGFMFSGSAADISSTLMNGAALHLYDVRQLGIAGLAAYLKREEISIFRPPIELLRYFLDTLEAGDRFPSVRSLVLSGDTLYKRDIERARAHFPRQALIVHDLASTEAGVLSRMLIQPGTKIESDIVPVGYAVPGKEILILDEDRNIAAPAQPGEICVRNRPDTTHGMAWPEFTGAETIPDPEHPSGTIYPTGDLGRLRPDGLLEFIGRKDFQYKIRGYRVDTAAIVSKLMELEGVRHAVVTARQDGNSEKRLVAYLVADPGRRPDVEALRRGLASSLPDYMLPSAFLFMDRIPVNENGKVDFHALPLPDWAHPNVQSGAQPPRDEVERKLVELWQEVLGVELVGVRDDFFALGGHSLTGASLCVRVEKELGKKLSPALLVENNTVERLAILLRRRSLSARIIIPIQTDGSQPPLFLAPGNEGDTLYFRALASHLGTDQPVYGLQATDVGDVLPPLADLETMAAYFLKEIRKVQPSGPYYLAGHSFGGRLVFAIAQLLVQSKERVNLLVLMDTFAPGQHPRATIIERLRLHADNLRALPVREWPGYFRQRFNSLIVQISGIRWLRPFIVRFGLIPPDASSKNRMAARGYVYRRYPGKLVLFRVDERPSYVRADLTGGWQDYASEVEVHAVPGDHANLLNEPQVSVLAEELRKCLQAAQAVDASRPG